MLDKVNLNLLRSLHVLLDECHVSRAAERLHITQSAMSRQLAQLRELTGDALLVRDGNGLIPTEKGKALQSKLAILLKDFESLFEDATFEPSRLKTEYVFSSSDYVAQYILPYAVKDFSEQSPLLSLNYRLWQPSHIDGLGDNGIHAVTTVLPEPPDNLDYIALGSDKSVCLMANTHPLVDKDNMTVSDICRYPHLKVSGGGDKDKSADKALRRIGVIRRIALAVPFFSSALKVLSDSDYLMLVPEHIAKNLAEDYGLTYRPLPVETPSHQYWMLWHPRYTNDSAHQWVRDIILKAMHTSPYSIGMISSNHE